MKLSKLALWSVALACLVAFVLPEVEGRGGGGGGGRGGGGFGGGRGGGGFGGGRPGPGPGPGRSGGGGGGREGERKEDQERDRLGLRQARVQEARIEYAKRERQQSFDDEASRRAADTLDRILKSSE